MPQTVTPQKLPLSVFMIAKNEEDRIGRAIKSVIDWVDEVIIVDSGSIDKTVKIAEALGAKTYHKDWQGFGRQKRYGESLCRNDWVLNMDADEVITPSLQTAIKTLFHDGQFAHDIYRVKRIIIPPYGKQTFTSYGIWDYARPGDYFKRLYNRHKAEYKDDPVHDSLILKDKNPRQDAIGTLKGIMLHYCFRSFSHMVQKIDFYSTMQAQSLHKRGRKISAARLMFEPLLSFSKAYFLRRYFLWGLNGFVESVIYSFFRVLRLAKLRELQNKPPRPDSQNDSQNES